MNLIIFAMLGGSIGWGLSRMMWAAHATLALVMNVVTGIFGALLAGWFLVPLLGQSAQSDFTVTASLVLLGAVALLAIVTVLRQAAGR